MLSAEAIMGKARVKLLRLDMRQGFVPHPAMQACCRDGAWQNMPATDAAWYYSQTG